jgi:hypothetical protein
MKTKTIYIISIMEPARETEPVGPSIQVEIDNDGSHFALIKMGPLCAKLNIVQLRELHDTIGKAVDTVKE